MSWEKGLSSQALKAGADLSSSQFLIMELTANINEVNLAAFGGGYGVLQNHPKSGEYGTVATDGQTRARAGASVSIGNYIRANSLGFAIALNSGDLGPVGLHKVLGRALSAAASGSVFTLDLDVIFLSTVSGAAI